MILHQLFCNVDDFCKDFLPAWRRTQLDDNRKKRIRNKCLSESEIVTIVIYFHSSGYRTFKWYYQKYVCVNLCQAFPKRPSYNRFVELISEILEPLMAFMQSRCGQSHGIAFVDSTPLCVCDNIRIPRHKTFANQAGRSKSSTGWFYGFKLHLIVNDCGDLLSFYITRGNVDDRKPVPKMTKNITGKLFGDKGYISKKLTAILADQDIELITTIKKNMKKKVMAAFDKLILRKRSIIETINDQLKNIGVLEHSRHRSLTNFFVNVIACLAAYTYQEKKPSLNLRNEELLLLLQ